MYRFYDILREKHSRDADKAIELLSCEGDTENNTKEPIICIAGVHISGCWDI